MSFGATLTNNTEGDFGAGNFFCAEAIVARNDDPENRCRVQCVVPIIDEDETHEIWARRFQLYVGETGFGDYFIPEVGAEVVLIGRLGDTNNLFYSPLWNESVRPSADFPNKSIAGLRVPQNLKFIAIELMKLIARNIEIVAEQFVKILAQNIEATAEQNVTINGQNITAVAQALAKLQGGSATVEASGTALLQGSSANVQGATISINGSGSISIQGGSVAINGSSVTLRGRQVNPTGPPI